MIGVSYFYDITTQARTRPTVLSQSLKGVAADINQIQMICDSHLPCSTFIARILGIRGSRGDEEVIGLAKEKVVRHDQAR